MVDDLAAIEVKMRLKAMESAFHTAHTHIHAAQWRSSVFVYGTGEILIGTNIVT